MQKLTGLDYATLPLVQLMVHPDFSPHAFRVINKVMSLETDQIEKLDLLGGRS